MQIGHCAYEINVKTLEAKEQKSIDPIIEAWLEDNDDKFIISIDVQRYMNPGFGFLTFATIVYRESSLKERGVE